MKKSMAWMIFMAVVCLAQASEYHVSKKGDDAAVGSKKRPFLTIQRAADLAQPGDVITVHDGVYRERVNPPRGGTSDTNRIVYQAAPGEEVIIKGAEVITRWEKLKSDVWTVSVPNTFFGEFNPFNDRIRGNWFNGGGRPHHTGAVYLNGHWLTEAAKKDEVFGGAVSTKKSSGHLFNVAWLRMIGYEEYQVSAADLIDQQGVQKARYSEGGECIGYINEGDWAKYADLDFGQGTEYMEFRVASKRAGDLIEIRLDSPQGDLLGTATVVATGGWQAWRTIKTDIIPTSGKKTIYLVFKARAETAPDTPRWFAEVDAANTTIWAQFKGVDPNQELIEVNARQSVFYPSNPNLNYITVRGFTLEQAATPWAPPTAEQIGLIGTHWSKGWIIENNVIRYSTCVGVTLGKYGDEFDNKAGSASGYNGTITRALSNGWNKENVGSHIVRNNDISHCEQAGMVGSLGAVFSTIAGNTIHDIHVRPLLGGPEMGGIKLHGSIDVLIAGNHIYRCGGSGGIWLDWMAQGTRISGNFLHDNSASGDLFVEVNHGPFLVDNNIFLSKRFLNDWSQGGAYVHNLIAGTIGINLPQARQTPFHKAHSTEIVGLHDIPGSDSRFINNVFMRGTNLSGYDKFAETVFKEGNIFSGSDVSLSTKSDGIYLEWDESVSDDKAHPLVTTELLGRTTVSDQLFDQPDGTPLQIDTDYFGNPRNPKRPMPGPFERQADQRMFKVWPDE